MISTETWILKMYVLLLTNLGKNTSGHMAVINTDTSLETSYGMSWFECAMYAIDSRLKACPYMVAFFLEVVAPLEVRYGRSRSLGVSPELQPGLFHPAKLSLCPSVCGQVLPQAFAVPDDVTLYHAIPTILAYVP